MKKSLALLVACILIFTVACSNNNNNAANSNSPSNSPGSSNTGASTPSDKPIPIRMVYKDLPPEDANTIKLVSAIEAGMLEEGYNIDLEVVPVQAGTYSEKLGLLLQSGNIPDLIYFQGGDYQYAMTQGILEDLTPYIENSTYYKNTLSDLNKERLANYPYLVWPSPVKYQVPAVRQDWLDKTPSGKELFENPTIDNYYKFFKELKEVNGAKYAFTTAGNLDEIETLFLQAFGLTHTWIKDADGKYVFGRTTQGEKEKLEFLAKLYKEQLLDPEFLTKKWDTKEKAFYDGEAAIMSGNQGPTHNVFDVKSVGQNGPSATVTPLPPAKGVAQGYTPVDVSKESRGLAISAISEHKDVVFAILEFMASPKGMMLDKLGIEGEEYVIENNMIKLTEKHNAWVPIFVESYDAFEPTTPIDPTTPYVRDAAIKSIDMFTQYSTIDNSFIIPSELAGKYDAAQELYKEFATNFVIGNKTSADFDKFVQDWYATGGKELTEYANTILK